MLIGTSFTCVKLFLILIKIVFNFDCLIKALLRIELNNFLRYVLDNQLLTLSSFQDIGKG